MMTDGKSEKSRSDAETNLHDQIVDRRLDLPKSFRGKSIHDIWGPGGPGPLIRRLDDEHKLGRSAPSPLTSEELATLVEIYGDEPSQALRDAVVRELRNQRRGRPGPKVSLAASEWLERHLLPIYYARGMHVAERYRRQMRIIEDRKNKRRDVAARVPTQAEVALRFVRKWLPSTRGLDDKTLANKLSALKDPMEKKLRAKSGQR